MHEQELYAARRRLMARRHRDGQLRLRAVLLSLALFGMFWALVFAQMVSGHDPVLSAKAAAATGGAPQKRGGRRNTQPQLRRSRQPQLAVDPETGAIVEVPASAPAPPAPAPPAPAPVTTSVS
jgi:hypothetical protein